jgi:hypothetical protein
MMPAAGSEFSMNINLKNLHYGKLDPDCRLRVFLIPWMVCSTIVELGNGVICEFNLGHLSSMGSCPLTLIKKSGRPRHIGAARFLTTAL